MSKILSARRSKKALFDKLAMHKKGRKQTGLSAELLKENEGIMEKAFETSFIQGIKTGLLDPTQYGGYTVQDAVYCYHATENLKKLEEKAEEKDLKEFAQAKFNNFNGYTKHLFREWHIKDPQGIELGNAASNYLQFIDQVLRDYPPVYMIIAFLPCDMLWERLAKRLEGYISETNVYSFWIEENLPGDGPCSWEEFVDSQDYDKDLAKLIFKAGMTCELNFFKSACNCELEPVPTMPKLSLGR